MNTGGADKSLARPGRKQATVTKLSFASHSKKNSEGCPSNQVSAAAMTSASYEKWRPFNCFYSRVGLKTYQHPLYVFILAFVTCHTNHIFCVLVHIAVSGLSGYTIFFHIFSYVAQFWDTVIEHKTCYDFLYNFCLKHFSFYEKNWSRYCHKCT